jgi:F-type H+-transporting ATPase subunit c
MTSKVEKAVRVACAVAIVFGLCAIPSFAQTTENDIKVAEASAVVWKPLAAIAAGLVTIGGAYGIGMIAAAAMEGTARQPEAAGAIRTSMIIAAALIEGFTFFALIVCIMSR